MWTRGTSKEQLFGIASGATKTLSQRGGRCSSLKFCVSIVHVLVVPKCSLFVFIFPIFIFLVLEFFTWSLSCHLTLFNTWIGRLGSQFFLLRRRRLALFSHSGKWNATRDHSIHCQHGNGPNGERMVLKFTLHFTDWIIKLSVCVYESTKWVFIRIRDKGLLHSTNSHCVDISHAHWPRSMFFFYFRSLFSFGFWWHEFYAVSVIGKLSQLSNDCPIFSKVSLFSDFS